jgi:hypothetical protein
MPDEDSVLGNESLDHSIWPRRTRRGSMTVLSLVVLATLLMGVMVLAYRLRQMPPVSSGVTQTPPSVLRGDRSAWQTYHDPFGLFSIKIPLTWTALHDEGTGSFGDRAGSYSFTSEGVGLRDSQEPQSFYVAFFITPLTTDYARQWVCRNLFSGAGATLGGIPARYDGGSVWYVDTQAAHFQINAAYPGGPVSARGSPMLREVPPTPTPVPTAQLQANEVLHDAILASIMFTPSIPLACAGG